MMSRVSTFSRACLIFMSLLIQDKEELDYLETSQLSNVSINYNEQKVLKEKETTTV
jgi:hypothetical protein